MFRCKATWFEAEGQSRDAQISIEAKAYSSDDDPRIWSIRFLLASQDRSTVIGSFAITAAAARNLSGWLDEMASFMERSGSPPESGEGP